MTVYIPVEEQKRSLCLSVSVPSFVSPGSLHIRAKPFTIGGSKLLTTGLSAGAVLSNERELAFHDVCGDNMYNKRHCHRSSTQRDKVQCENTVGLYIGTVLIQYFSRRD